MSKQIEQEFQLILRKNGYPFCKRISMHKQANQNISKLRYNSVSNRLKINVNKSTQIQRLPLLSSSKNIIKKQGTFKKQIKFPLSQFQLVSEFKHLLSKDQLKQVTAFPTVYWLGVYAKKVSRSLWTSNDDIEGNYKVIISDHLAYRYQVQQCLGKGSFGQVVKVYDHKNNRQVAIKIISNTKSSLELGSRQVQILKLIKKKQYCKNLVEIKSAFTFRNHLCIVFQLLFINLYELIRNFNFRGLTLATTHKIIYQLLTALNQLLSLGIYHCDLKPENIMLKSDKKTKIKLIDFGSCCLKNQPKLFSYIQSRFYRAPEVVLNLPYNQKIDVWSIGCLLAQMLTGAVLFPAQNQKQLLKLIIQVIGAPPPQIREKSSTIGDILAGKQGQVCRRPLSSIFEQADQRAVQVIRECLQWLPSGRPTVGQLLEYPFMAQLLPTQS